MQTVLMIDQGCGTINGMKRYHHMKHCFKGATILMAMMMGLVLATAAHAAKPYPDRYIVSFLDNAKGRSALRAAGAGILRELPNQGAVAAYIPAPALKGLLRNPNIEYIEVDALRYPMSETVPWGIPTIQADAPVTPA
jgi:serine protease